MNSRRSISYNDKGKKTIIIILFLVFLSDKLFMTVTLSAQSIETEKKSWTFISRLAATSVSDESNPAGYKVYSSITVNAGVRWEFIHPFALEIILNTESREVDNIDPQGHENSLGSIDLIPITLLLQYHPDLAEWIHPYIGVGFNVTRFFEKSGILNPQRLSNSTGMAYQVGVDFDISSYAVCNVDVKSVAMTTNIEADGNNNIRLKINPFTFGIGLGFRL